MAVAAAVCGASAAADARAATAQGSSAQGEVLLEDGSDVVTSVDLGFNDFSGNTGAINRGGRPYGRVTFTLPEPGRGRLGFAWDFSIDPGEPDAFTGIFHSLFGLTDTKVSLDGTNVESLEFDEHALDFDNIDGVFVEPGEPRRITDVRFTVSSPAGSDPVTLRAELTDTAGHGRYSLPRFRIEGGATRTFTWNFRDPSASRETGQQAFDSSNAKVLAFIVERRHVGDQVTNPDSGELFFDRIAFGLDGGGPTPSTDAELLELIERRGCQYFLDWSSRKARSLAVPQDRSTFADLLSVGGVGFALPAYIICAERGWITRAEAAARVGAVLDLLADPAGHGPQRVGRLGHRGWLYHFLGPDGHRKQNFDFPSTPINERRNTVELSTIDTGLALMGVLAAQSYFTASDAAETKIRRQAQQIYNAVDWPFMLDAGTQQFYLGWKPNEERDGPPFEIADAAGQGAFSGLPDDPATLDFYTDEAFIVTMLAAGSTTHAVPRTVHCAWQRVRDDHGLVRTFPGALFTYQFLHAFLDTRTLDIPACPGEADAFDVFENSRRATLTAIGHAETNPPPFTTYGRDAWGLSAAEGPDDQYRAYAAPPLALDRSPPEDGTVTYYAMASAVGFGDALRDRAIAAVRRASDRGHIHPRFGLPDAFNDDIADADLRPTPGTDTRILRNHGTWLQRARFAIDEGPMLLHLANARSGLVWKLLADNPNIRVALDRLRRRPHTTITSGPSSPTSDTTPTFAFDSDEPAATFECSLDGATFASCTSPSTQLVLTDGEHRIRVRARDVDGYVDPTPAERSFTLDTTAPDTAIEFGPTGATTDSTPTFGFSSSEPDATLECSVDGGVFASCSSPFTTTPLADGQHAFHVRATDSAGNTDTSPASRTFTVADPPETTIDSGPSAIVDDPTPTFEFSSDEPASAFECRIDDAAFAACSSPFTTTPLADGQHAFHVRATDSAGNTDTSPASRTFTVRAPRCHGLRATIVVAAGSNPVSGTAHADVIVGSADSNSIKGGGGADLICGRGGADQLSGGTGNDRLSGGGGQDRLSGGRGGDRLGGGRGRDQLNAGPGSDRLLGGIGDDRLLGATGNDDLDGGPARDFCRGGRGTDTTSNCER